MSILCLPGALLARFLNKPKVVLQKSKAADLQTPLLTSLRTENLSFHECSTENDDGDDDDDNDDDTAKTGSEKIQCPNINNCNERIGLHFSNNAGIVVARNVLYKYKCSPWEKRYEKTCNDDIRDIGKSNKHDLMGELFPCEAEPEGQAECFGYLKYD
ncbi:hypothetical protein DUI87_10946 [Hirundo rustica rustica]|uniref:Uncharacterized protein n=1 Tax=Hirundo rustica rustica TaxID=333673 RepID=A0A3M0KJH3_HIRRU|nr:hypothetical protein DUI87_10946 [Hirundo rustica rustica]